MTNQIIAKSFISRCLGQPVGEPDTQIKGERERASWEVRLEPPDERIHENDYFNKKIIT